MIRACPLFDGVGEGELDGVLRCLGARPLEAEKGETIFREGAGATQVGIVLSGAVQMVRTDFYGNRSIVAHIGPSQLFGESYACAGVDALPVSVVADETSKVLLIDCRRITACCTNACAFHSRVIFNLLRLVATKNLVFDQKIEVTSKRTTREKLLTYLMQQAKRQGSDSVTIPYDRQGLADYLEVERSGLSSEIGKLCREGVIACEKNRFRLLEQQQ